MNFNTSLLKGEIYNENNNNMDGLVAMVIHI